MLEFRDRVEKLRVAKCVMAGRQPYGYFESVFSEQRWPKYAANMGALHSTIVATIKGETVLGRGLELGESTSPELAPRNGP